MRVWLRLTHLFGLPDGHHPGNLMQAALGPVLRAACHDVVDAPLPEPIATLAQELAQGGRPIRPPEHPRTLARRVSRGIQVTHRGVSMGSRAN